MAKQWSGEVDEPAKDDTGVDKDLGLMSTPAGKSWPAVLVTEDDPLLRTLAVIFLCRLEKWVRYFSGHSFGLRRSGEPMPL
jgi:hypothetical protein